MCMESVAFYLIFCMALVSIIGIVAVYCLSMYLREYPKVKHKTKADLKNNIYETETQTELECKQKKLKK